MSRVGKNIISVPSGVTVSITGANVLIKGQKGELSYDLPASVELINVDGGLEVKPKDNNKQTRMLYGTTQRNIANLVVGVSKGFTKIVNLVGVGYRADVQGSTLVLKLGYSHDINYKLPDGISVSVEKNTVVNVSGANKQLVGQVVSELKQYRKPEPYKGKGVIPEGFFILKKEGKKK